jgi:flagellar protein FliO/FliZ
MKAYLPILFLFTCIYYPSFFLLGQTDEVSSPTVLEESYPNFTQDSDPLSDSLEKEPDDFKAKFLNMLVLLGLLIGFMLLASWFIKKLGRTRAEQLNTTSNIKLLESRYLSPKVTIHLLEILGEGYVIAESHAGITYLNKISLEEERKQNPNFK